MKRIKYLIIASTFSLMLAGCASDSKINEETPANELYASAQTKMQEGGFRAAIKELESLDNRYPFGPYSVQVQLDLIYAYYKSAELALAQASIDRFIRLNPTHPNIDYVLYMRGLTNMALDDNTIQGLFGMDRSDRDAENARVAFKDFSLLVTDYQDSPYGYDAEKRLVFLKNRLAKYELSIAQYYTQRGAYAAVINRVESMLKDFPDTVATRQALPLMQNAYTELGLLQQAEKVKQFIQANPVSS